MTLLYGTHLQVQFVRVVDGDTIRVKLPGQDDEEALRILALDTEETHAGSKPVTPWGRKASERAKAFFQNADEVTIEFPGNEDLETCLQKYRGNFGRLLVFVYRDGVDFQQTMIEEGYSPYFVKYGNAAFTSHHLRYTQAEITAQRAKAGVWDQVSVNGSELRNYAALGTWWKLRASVIDDFRSRRRTHPHILNTRLDYAQLQNLARVQVQTTVFTEVRSVFRVGGIHALVTIGSNEQPFNLFIPDMDSEQGQDIINLLNTRYISSAEDHPRQSYVYVSGSMSLYDDKPQMVIHSASQFADNLLPTSQASGIKIAALLPNPEGRDAGHETATLINQSNQTIDLTGWLLKDLAGNQQSLSGELSAGQQQELILQGNLRLNNTGDEVSLVDQQGQIRHQVSYTAQDVVSGRVISFIE